MNDHGEPDVGRASLTERDVQSSRFRRAQDLIAQLVQNGVLLSRTGTSIHYSAPAGTLTSKTRNEISRYKEEILALLPEGKAETLPSAGRISLIDGDECAGSHLFCIHAIDCGIEVYASLARRISHRVKTYGISALDLRSKVVFPGTLREIAASYTDKIFSVQPVGPYLVLGWSLGGQIAFEVAREILRRRGTVAAVFVIDSLPAPDYENYHAVTEQYWTLNLSHGSIDLAWERFLFLHTSGFLRSLPGEFWTLRTLEKCQFLLDNRSDLGLDDRGGALSVAKCPEDVHYMFELTNQLWNAKWHWDSKCYPGGVIYFKSIKEFEEIRMEAAERERISFWRHLTAGEFEVKWVRGGHDAALREPQVDVLARRVLKSLGESAWRN